MNSKLTARYTKCSLMASTTPEGSAAAGVFHRDAYEAAQACLDAATASDRKEWARKVRFHYARAAWQFTHSVNGRVVKVTA